MKREKILKTFGIFEKILVTLYAQNSKISRRELATYILIAEHFTETRFIDVFDIYPDGVESTRINLAVDTLIENGLIYSDFGRLFLTKYGKIEAERVLSSPEEKTARDFYRLVEYLSSLSHRTRLDLAGYIWFREMGLNVEGFKRTKSIYEKLEEKFLKRWVREELKTPIITL